MVARDAGFVAVASRVPDLVRHAFSNIQGGRFLTAASIAIFALFIALTALLPLKYPESNWDMLAYLAVAQEDRIADPAALHDRVYAQVEAVASEEEFRQLAQGNDYRVRQANDPAAFHSMLPMYRVKLLYTELARGIEPVAGWVGAFRAINIGAALMAGLALLAWMRGAGAAAMAAPVAIVLGLARWPEIVRLLTPDALSAALLLCSASFFIRRWEIPLAVVVFAAFLARPDNIVFAATLAAGGLMLRDRSYGALAGFAACLVAYRPLTESAGHIGWWAHFWFSTVRYELDMTGFAPAFSLLVYMKSLVLGAARAVIEGVWPALAGAGVAAWAFAYRFGLRLTDREIVLLLAALVAIMAKFALFPLHEGRFYFPLSGLPLIVVAIAAPRLFGAGGHAQRGATPAALS